MNQKTNGSILLEAIIALGITSFLIISTTQLTRTGMRTLKEVVQIHSYMNKVITTTHQLEKDLSCLVALPTPHKETPAENKERETKQVKAVSRALIGEANEKQAQKIANKTYLMFKSLNGITTSPLQSYGENKPHFVRFWYKLIKQTLPSPHQKKPSFKLYRRETITIDDINMKQDGEPKHTDIEKNTEWVAICTNIKSMVIEYSTLSGTQNQATSKTTESKGLTKEEPATQQYETKKREDGPEIVTSQEWPNKKLGQEIQEQTPLFITIILELWDDAFITATTYKKIIPCLNYSGTLAQFALQQKQNDKKRTEKTQAETNPKDNKSVETKPLIEKIEVPEPTPSTLPSTLQQLENTSPVPISLPETKMPLATPKSIKKPKVSEQIQSQNPEVFFIPDHEIPEEMLQIFEQLEQTDLAKIDPEKVLSELPPEIADAVRKQMEEFERNPEKLYQSAMELFK